MLTRILTALVGIPIVVALVFWPGGIPFSVLIGLAALIGLLEFYRAARHGGMRPLRVPGMLAALLLIYIICSNAPMSLTYVLPVFVGLVIVCLSLELVRSQRAPLSNTATTVLGLVYVVLLLLHFPMLRNTGTDIRIGGLTADMGAWLVMFVLLCTWALDSGAYFVGRFYGTRKLAPDISPGKTVEGAVGGFVSALIVGAVTAAVIGMPQPHGLILGGLIGITGQVGDLAASAIKREVGIKDFGSLIPGHGGVLDRLDSLLFTGPVMLYYTQLFLGAWTAGGSY